MSTPPASGVVLLPVPCRQGLADALEPTLPFGCFSFHRLPHVELNPIPADQPVPTIASEVRHE